MLILLYLIELNSISRRSDDDDDVVSGGWCQIGDAEWKLLKITSLHDNYFSNYCNINHRSRIYRLTFLLLLRHFWIFFARFSISSSLLFSALIFKCSSPLSLFVFARNMTINVHTQKYFREFFAQFFLSLISTLIALQLEIKIFMNK